MKASAFKKLTVNALIEKTKTLTKVTFGNIRDYSILVKELTKEETPFKEYKDRKLVTVTTSRISAYLDLAEHIMSGKTDTGIPHISNKVLREAFLKSGPANWLKKTPDLRVRKIKDTDTFTVTIRDRVMGKDRIAKKFNGSVIFLTLDQDIRIDSVDILGQRFTIGYTIINSTTRKPAVEKKVEIESKVVGVKFEKDSRFHVSGKKRDGTKISEHYPTLKKALAKTWGMGSKLTCIDLTLARRENTAAIFDCYNANTNKPIKGYCWSVFDSYKKVVGTFESPKTDGCGKKRKFENLKVENSWKIRTFFIGGVKIAPDSKSKTRSVVVKVGSSLTDTQYRWDERYDVVSDHGVNSGVHYYMMQLKAEVFGTTVWIDVEEIKGIKLDISQFKVYTKPKQDYSGRKSPKRKYKVD